MLIPKVTQDTKIKAIDLTRLTSTISAAQSGLASTTRQLRLSKPSGTTELKLIQDYLPLNGTYSNDTPAVTGRLYFYDTAGEKVPSWYSNSNYNLIANAHSLTNIPTLDTQKANGKLFNNDLPCATEPLCVKITGSGLDGDGYEYASFSIPMGPVPVPGKILFIKASVTQSDTYHVLTAASPNSVSIHTCTLNWDTGILNVLSSNNYTLPGQPTDGDPFTYIRDFACYTYEYSPTAPYGTFTTKLAAAFALRTLGTTASKLVINYEHDNTNYLTIPGFTNLNGVGVTAFTLYTTNRFVVSASTVPWAGGPPTRAIPGGTLYDGRVLTASGKLISIYHQSTQPGFLPSAITHMPITSIATYGGDENFTAPIVSNSKLYSSYHVALPSQGGIGNPVFQTAIEAIGILPTITWDAGMQWISDYNNWMMAGVANLDSDVKSTSPKVYLRNLAQGALSITPFGTTVLTTDANFADFSTTNFPTATLVSPYVTGTVDSCSTLICCNNQAFIVDTDRNAAITNRRPVYITGLDLRNNYTVGLNVSYSIAEKANTSKITIPPDGSILNEDLSVALRAPYPYKLSTSSNLGASIIQDKPLDWYAMLDVNPDDWNNIIAPAMFSEDASTPPIVDGSAACLLYASNGVYNESSKIPLPTTRCLFIPSAFVTGAVEPASGTFTDKVFMTDNPIHPTVTLTPYETIRCRGANACKTVELSSDSVSGQVLTLSTTFSNYMLVTINRVNPNQFLQSNMASVQFLNSSSLPLEVDGVYRKDIQLSKVDTKNGDVINETKGIYGYHNVPPNVISGDINIPEGTRYIRILFSSGVWSSNGKLPADTKTQPALVGALAIHKVGATIT